MRVIKGDRGAVQSSNSLTEGNRPLGFCPRHFSSLWKHSVPILFLLLWQFALVKQKVGFAAGTYKSEVQAILSSARGHMFTTSWLLPPAEGNLHAWRPSTSAFFGSFSWSCGGCRHKKYGNVYLCVCWAFNRPLNFPAHGKRQWFWVVKQAIFSQYATYKCMVSNCRRVNFLSSSNCFKHEFLFWKKKKKAVQKSFGTNTHTK